MRNLAKAGPLRAAADDAGVTVEVVQLDITDDASVRSAVARVIDADDRIDALINNAGSGGASRPIEELSDDDWMSVLDANLLGAVRTTRAVLPTMRAQGSGTVVNVSSLAGRLPGSPISSAYAASKHALCAFSDSLWSEVEQFGITVSCIEPGFFATSIVDNSTFGLVGPESPYHDLTQAMERFYLTAMEGAPAPRAVIDAIVGAVDDPTDDSIHRPVGADAEMMLAALPTMTYSEFREVGRQLMGFS
jgi:NAD(P)-dependent dehydrogenase (short-subunit alcohol dehydrogenase family)